MSKKALIIIFFTLATTIFVYKFHKNTKKLSKLAQILEEYKILEKTLEEYKILATEIPFPLVENSQKNLDKTIIVSHFSLDYNFIHNVIKNHQQYAKQHGYDYWFRNGIIDSKLVNLKNKTRMGLSWQKLIAISQAMNITDGSKYKYAWIMWIDGDAVFTNFDKNLAQLKTDLKITEKDYFIIARDMYCKADNDCPVGSCFNAGVFLIRNNIQGQTFINNIIKSFAHYKDHYGDYPFAEQHPINDYIIGAIKLNKDSIYIDYEKINSVNKCLIEPIKGVRIVSSNVMNSGFSKNNSLSDKNLWKAGDLVVHFAGIGKKSREQLINSFLTCTLTYQKDLSKCEFNNLKNIK